MSRSSPPTWKTHRPCRAREGADAVFFTSPSFTQAAKAADHCRRLGEAARDAGVRRVVYNTTSWHPEEPIGVPSMDWSYEKTACASRDGGAAHRRQAVALHGQPADALGQAVPPRGRRVLVPAQARPRGELDLPRRRGATDDRDARERRLRRRDAGRRRAWRRRPTEVARLLGDVLGRPVVYRQMRRGSSASGCTRCS